MHSSAGQLVVKFRRFAANWPVAELKTPESSASCYLLGAPRSTRAAWQPRGGGEGGQPDPDTHASFLSEKPMSISCGTASSGPDCSLLRCSPQRLPLLLSPSTFPGINKGASSGSRATYIALRRDLCICSSISAPARCKPWYIPGDVASSSPKMTLSPGDGSNAPLCRECAKRRPL